MSQPLEVAARRFADTNSARLTAAAGARRIVATVQTVTPGAASDGNALVTILWRGDEYTVSGYAASYAPVAGHRVVCDYIDNQPIIAYRVIGQP